MSVQLGLSPKQLAAVDAFKKDSYPSDAQVPYHGVSHAADVWEAAKKLIERCQSSSIKVDVDVLYVAIALHDAYSHVPARGLGYPNAEAFAAYNTGFCIRGELGMSPEAAQKGERIVMASNPGVLPQTPEEIIMRAADLASVGGDYQGYKQGSLKLWQERQNLDGPCEYRDWLKGGLRYLSRFMWPMLELTSEARDGNGRSVFHVNGLRNMITMWSETFASENPEVVAEFFSSGKITPSRIAPGAFYVAIHPEQETRRGAVEELDKLAASNAGVAVAVPGEKSAFPLPDETCSKVICHDPSWESFQEALRVTKDGGAIILVSADGVLDLKVSEALRNLPHILREATSGDSKRHVVEITKSASPHLDRR
jgi:hypothetical protein